MLIRRKNGQVFIETEKQERAYFEMKVGQNGKKYADRQTVTDTILHVVMGNSKTGEEVVNFNFPIEYTCKHTCEC